jgi:Predicted periplasmic protein (DUF2271)
VRHLATTDLTVSCPPMVLTKHWNLSAALGRRRPLALFWLLILSCVTPTSLSAAEKLSVEFFSPNVGLGKNEYFVAVWLSKDGAYVCTLGYFGERTKYFPQMRTFWPAISQDLEKALNPSGVDANMGGTKTYKNDPPKISGKNYSFTDIDVSKLPDGTYTVHFETVRHNNALMTATAKWSKNGAAMPRTLQSVNNFMLPPLPKGKKNNKSKTPAPPEKPAPQDVKAASGEIKHPFKDVYFTYSGRTK